jgi:hypothetical protein
MKTSFKLRMLGWVSILAVPLNEAFQFAPKMRDDASLIIGMVLLVGGIILKEIETLINRQEQK